MTNKTKPTKTALQEITEMEARARDAFDSASEAWKSAQSEACRPGSRAEKKAAQKQVNAAWAAFDRAYSAYATMIDVRSTLTGMKARNATL